MNIEAIERPDPGDPSIDRKLEPMVLVQFSVRVKDSCLRIPDRAVEIEQHHVDRERAVHAGTVPAHARPRR